MKTYLTLNNVICKRRIVEPQGWTDWDGELTGPQRIGIVEIFGKGCRAETKMRLRRSVADNCRRVNPCGIVARVHLDDNGASYCAGQSYPDEIRTVRQLLIASY